MPEAIDRGREAPLPNRRPHEHCTRRARFVKRASVLGATVLLAVLAPRAAEAQLNLYSTLEVDTTSDALSWSDGTCSLREAILNVNSHGQGGAVAGECEAADGSIGSKIVFDPAVFGGGAEIAPHESRGPLPPITADYTIIDGWSAGGSGYSGPPLVTLNGALLLNWETNYAGIALSCSSSTVRGLALENFGPSPSSPIGALFISGDHNRIQGMNVNYNDYGIWIGAGSGNLIGTDSNGVGDAQEQNVLLANQSGIVVSSADNIIAGNFVTSLHEGIVLETWPVPSARVVVRDNVIVGNRDYGVHIGAGCTADPCAEWSSNHRVYDNLIGLDADGVTVIGNGQGIYVDHSAGNLIRGNYVSGNTDYGIRLAGHGTWDNLLEDNVIGLDMTGQPVYQQAVGLSIEQSTWGNTVRGNTLTGSTTQLEVTGSEAAVEPDLIQDNWIGADSDGSAVAWLDAGVTLSGSSYTRFEDNSLTSCARALVLSGTATALLRRNRVFESSSSGEAAITLQDTAAALSGSTDNCIENNAIGVVNLTGTTAVLELNWWGDASGPSGAGSGAGDSVSLNVDFDPWLTARPDCGVRLLFLDGFESADTHYWSSTTP